MDKASRKKEKFKYSGNESQRVDLDQKRELQKCNETFTSQTVTTKANNVLLCYKRSIKREKWMSILTHYSERKAVGKEASFVTL